MRLEAGALIAKLTRSKTLGIDTLVSSRRVIVDPEVYFRNRHWVVDGWNLLQIKAPSERDYLPVEIAKVFSARNYNTTQHSQFKRDYSGHFPIVGPGSSMLLSRISGLLTADAIFYRQQRLSWECELRTKNYWGDGLLRAASGTTE